ITDGTRCATQQCRNFGTGLGKPENVVDKEQNVLILLVAKILSDCQASQRDAQTGAGRLVHLAVNKSHSRFVKGVLLDDTSLVHFVVQIIAFAAALAYTCEHRYATMKFGNIVDELHDDNRFTHSRATEGADLAPFQEWANQIDDLDAG